MIRNLEQEVEHPCSLFHEDKKSNKERTKRRKLIGNGCKYYQKKRLQEFAENVFVSDFF